MQLRNDELVERILEAAKSEFLEKGYRQASVRSIAASVGVTTGALYRYYANKEALFDALVSGPADYLYDQCKSFSEAYSRQELDEQLANLPELTRDSDGGTSDFLKYIYQNYDAFKLIVCCSAGTKYEDYPERLIAIETASSAALVHLMQKAGRLSSDLDDTMIHIVVSSMFTGIFEIIAHDAPMDVALRHISILQDFYTAGWYKILGIL